MPSWDAEVYSAFADERSRPFTDLLARVRADDARRVVDLGCGPGPLTAGLAVRWPGAEVLGVDSSTAMIDAARPHAGPRVSFVLADLADLAAWAPAEPLDVVLSNAALQWVPDHRALLPALVDLLADGGWLAFQVPGNHDAPSHRALRAVAAQEPFAEHTAGVTRTAVAEPADYLGDLAGLGCEVDAWETTYLHVLAGPDPVLHWLEGTGARPYVDALPDPLRPAFTAALRDRLAEAYPARPWGTVLPFRRLFVVARRGAGTRPRGGGR
ncbi:methyltransferase domain-containing protein [Microlunatus flavus]|uniref:Trans-aconitate 2-methyltransferase n=1 Tax=Microlunatus flavus TaxID=1036181 RepID=A0A1H9DRZ2_9ACTN|nr:methyltransferase domain-containing protein [Microlunatus flavus]SEQ16229.1 trans-aconitate 2-methyltransferase [Microlunatus flavus]